MLSTSSTTFERKKCIYVYYAIFFGKAKTDRANSHGITSLYTAQPASDFYELHSRLLIVCYRHYFRYVSFARG